MVVWAAATYEDPTSGSDGRMFATSNACITVSYMVIFPCVRSLAP